jgi:hypothetical protein
LHRLSTLFIAAIAAAIACQVEAAGALTIYFIDVEGGQSTLRQVDRAVSETAEHHAHVRLRRLL